MAKGTVNKVILLGRVGKDPEKRGSVVTFSVATDESYKNAQGENVEKTTWHNITAFAKKGDFIMSYVKKGDRVYVEGKISHYTTEGENSKTIVSVNVETIELLSDKKKTEDI